MSIARALGFGGRLTHDRAVLGGLDDNMQKLSHVKHMSMSACGSSLYAAKYGEKLMKQLGNFDTVSVLDASETENKVRFFASNRIIVYLVVYFDCINFNYPGLYCVGFPQF